MDIEKINSAFDNFFVSFFYYFRLSLFFLFDFLKKFYFFLLRPSTINFLEICFLFVSFLLFLASLVLLREIEFIEKSSGRAGEKIVSLKRERAKIARIVKKLEQNPNKEVLKRHIIEAEKILFDYLDSLGIRGDDFLEKIEKSREIISNFEDLKKAHSFKEKISEGEDFEFEKGESVLLIYLQAFRLLGIS